MFIGHFAVAFAAKPLAPRVSLGTLFVATELVDLIWPLFLLAGLEQVRIDPGNTAFTPLDFVSYPWTHSLLTCAAWAAALAALYFLIRKEAGPALVLGARALSHWLLDAASHRPDLPLAPGGDARIGLGLWNSVAATLAVEGLLFAAGLFIYVRATRARDAKGSIGLWAMVALLLAAYAGAAFGPAPPSVAAIAWTGIAGGIVFGGWAYWLERHRQGRQ